MNRLVIILFVLVINNCVQCRVTIKSGNDVYNLEDREQRRCGYEGCPKTKSNMLNVHMVPHTHDDVGWLKTVDQYYYGSKIRIQRSGVQYIIDSVIQSLLSDPAKRFIYVESAFFFMWWEEQTAQLQEQVKMLVNEGRLEFIGGAWSMNDEAVTHYQSIIDQFTWGLRRLNDTFGECGRPRVGWQIDPFGHSREQASIFARMGFDGMFLGRLDYDDKEIRLKSKNAEMIWKASANLGDTADLFTGVLFNNYGPPPGFCFDILCTNEPIIDKKSSPDNNVEEMIDKFLSYVEDQSEYYRSNHIILTMGGDFTYQDANMYYKNMDKLIRYANDRQANGSKAHLFYSTPSCYLKSLHEANLTWPTKSDDFFPYASDEHSFWTGYYTSRSTLKRFERIGNEYLQICKQLTALAPESEDYFEQYLSYLREEMGIMQHHDAITGTEKQHVAEDYSKRLHIAIDGCGRNIKSALNQFTTGQLVKNYTFTFSDCLELNITKCEISETSNNFMVTVYNPLGYSTFAYIRIPVPSINCDVIDYNGVAIPIQFVEIPDAIKQLHYRVSNSAYELIFLANELPAMGYKSYYVRKKNTTPDNSSLGYHPADNETVVIGNKYLNVTFNEKGFVSNIFTEGDNMTLSQNFYYYQSIKGHNFGAQSRSSGAYVFRPADTTIDIASSAKLYVIKGHLVDEVHQEFNEWISQVVRVYKDDNFVEFEWMVGSIPSGGKEIVSKFSSNIDSNSTFFTDSNGRETIKRVRNYRPTWDVQLKEEISGNYYPVTTKIALEDSNWRMAVLTDRAQGGSSINDGELELMVHRRLMGDDSFGVDEPLNEKAYGKALIARGSHYLIVGKKSKQNPSVIARERFLQAKKLASPWPFFSDISSLDFEDWRKQNINIKSALSISLPINVHLLTFEPWKNNSYLVRLEHLLEKDEDKFYSNSVTINLKDVFRTLPFTVVRETNLAANQWLPEIKRFKFKEEKLDIDESISNLSNDDTADSSMDQDLQDYEITLNPMEIRTFILYNER